MAAIRSWLPQLEWLHARLWLGTPFPHFNNPGQRMVPSKDLLADLRWLLPCSYQQRCRGGHQCKGGARFFRMLATFCRPGTRVATVAGFRLCMKLIHQLCLLLEQLLLCSLAAPSIAAAMDVLLNCSSSTLIPAGALHTCAVLRYGSRPVP